MKGFISFDRQILHKITAEHSDLCWIWNALNLYASLKDGTQDVYHGEIDTIRGQCAVTDRQLAKWFGCSRDKIRYQLKKLESLDLIEFVTHKIRPKDRPRSSTRSSTRSSARSKNPVHKAIIIKSFQGIGSIDMDSKNPIEKPATTPVVTPDVAPIKEISKKEISKKQISKQGKDARAHAYDPPKLELLGQDDIKPKKTRQKRARVTAYSPTHVFAQAFKFLNMWEPFNKIFDVNKDEARLQHYLEEGLTAQEIANVCKDLWVTDPEVKNPRGKLNTFLTVALQRKKKTGTTGFNFGNTKNNLYKAAKDELSRRCDEAGWD